MGIIRPGPIQSPRLSRGPFQRKYRRAVIIFALVISVFAIGLWRISNSPLTQSERTRELSSFLASVSYPLVSEVGLAQELTNIQNQAPSYSRQALVTNLVNLNLAASSQVKQILVNSSENRIGANISSLSMAETLWLKALNEYELAIINSIGPGVTLPVSAYGTVGVDQLANHLWSQASKLFGTNSTSSLNLAARDFERGEVDYRNFIRSLSIYLPRIHTDGHSRLHVLVHKASVRKNVELGRIIKSLPRQINWVSVPQDWTPQALNSFQVSLEGSRSLRATHQVQIVTSSIYPTPTPSLVSAALPAIIGANSITCSVVVSNAGNVIENQVPVQLTITQVSKLPSAQPIPGGITTPTTTPPVRGLSSVNQTQDTILDPGQDRVITFSNLVLEPGYSYSLQFQVGPIAGQSTSQATTYQTQFSVES